MSKKRGGVDPRPRQSISYRYYHSGMKPHKGAGTSGERHKKQAGWRAMVRSVIAAEGAPPSSATPRWSLSKPRYGRK